MPRLLASSLVLCAALLASATGWAAQDGKDGIELKKPKEGCLCPGTHLPNCPNDGIWCPPWWCCPFDPLTIDPARLKPFPIFPSLVVELGKTTVTTKFVTATIITGNPRNDPPSSKPTPSPTSISSKPALFGGGGSSDPQDSDTHLLFGPDLDFPLVDDVTEWQPTSWLPKATSLHAYATILFGSFTVFDTTADMELYSAGLRLEIPILTLGDAFTLSTYISAGPAYLHTSIGNALGVDLGLGLRGTLSLSKSFALMATFGVNAFSSSETYSWGPAFGVGFVLSW